MSIGLCDVGDYYANDNDNDTLYGFIGFGVTCGEVGFYRLLRSEWYKENQQQADRYIHDFHTTRFMRVLVIPSSRCNQGTYLSWAPVAIRKSAKLPVLDKQELQFLQRMISIAASPSPSYSVDCSLPIPNWWLFGGNGVVVRRVEIVNTLYQQEHLQEALRLHFYIDLVTVICEFCEFNSMQEALLWNQDVPTASSPRSARQAAERNFGRPTGVTVLPGQWIVINQNNQIELYDKIPTDIIPSESRRFCKQFTGHASASSRLLLT